MMTNTVWHSPQNKSQASALVYNIFTIIKNGFAMLHATLSGACFVFYDRLLRRAVSVPDATMASGLDVC